MLRVCLVALTAALGFGGADPVLAAVYRVTDLGTLGGSYSEGLAINARGQVVGVSYTNGKKAHAFLYSGGTMIDLGDTEGEARGINASEEVVGWSGNHAFRHAGGKMKKLFGEMDWDPEWSDARGINNNGQVVGCAAVSGGGAHAFRYSPDGILDLGTLGGATSEANGINDAGQVVGGSYKDGNVQHAFLYSGDTMTDLGTLGGSDSMAYGINSRGQIVGYARTGNQQIHGFLYSGGTMSDLGTLGGTLSEACGINDLGQIVGYSLTGDAESHAFLYDDDGMTDLNSLVSSDFTISRAWGINNAGQIVASGSSGSETHALLLSLAEPVPEPSSLVLWSGLGLVGLIAARRRLKNAAVAN